MAMSSGLLWLPVLVLALAAAWNSLLALLWPAGLVIM